MEICLEKFDVEVHGVKVVSVHDVHVIQTDDLLSAGNRQCGEIRFCDLGSVGGV